MIQDFKWGKTVARAKEERECAANVFAPAEREGGGEDSYRAFWSFVRREAGSVTEFHRERLLGLGRGMY